ncbi:MAG: IS1595 family transposase [Acidobacteria bacterium]|nr:MAG: IS1595 family transposase [Acidobacteriota bacterium]
MNRKPKMTRYTKKHFDFQFPDDATCLEWLFRRFYPDGTVFCDKCQKQTKHHRVVSRPSYSCDYCGHHVHPTADTIFHKSPTPLTTWFYAIYLMASTRCGISAKQIERETGVTYKTAWRMFKQIRMMLDDENGAPFGGKGTKGVEIDETYIGGRRRGLRGRVNLEFPDKKTPVVGVVERGGSVRAYATLDTKKDTIMGIIKERVLPQSTVFTDDYCVYDDLKHHRNEYTHHRINHSQKVYVVGNIHTNTIEGFWSLVKNGLRGVYHSVGKPYLQSYLNEYSFRYNRRFDVQPMFTSFLNQITKRDAVVRSAPAVQEPF